MSEAWKVQAACRGRGPQLFFPETEAAAAAAAAVCAGCPVKVPCRRAGQSEPYGVWGGRWHNGAVLTEDTRVNRATRATRTTRPDPPNRNRTCTRCGSPFYALHTAQLYCGDQCRMLAFAARKRAS